MQNEHVPHTSNNVITHVVTRRLCCGCGICAGVCPQQTLQVRFNEYGELVPHDDGASCSPGCDLCLLACPFAEQALDEDNLGDELFGAYPGMLHSPETGYYLENSLGFSKVHNHRENGSSGGLATWVLEKLLSEKKIDHAVCVKPANNTARLFDFAVCTTPDEVRMCSRSCYYPVEMSRSIQQILARDGRYAIVALPCVIKALRQAMKAHAKLRKRIRLLLGLVCSQGKSKFFAEWVCAMGGGDPHQLDGVQFRVKDPRRDSRDYGTRFICSSGSDTERSGVVHLFDFPSDDFSFRYFTLNACEYCSDTFAELADATFMDAWLPEYIEDYRGHSIVLSRNKEISEMLKSGSDEVQLQPVGIDSVIESQSRKVHYKRNLIANRCRLPQEDGSQFMCRRPPLCSDGGSEREQLLTQTSRQTLDASRQEWVRSKKHLARFTKAMAPYLAREKAIRTQNG